MTKAQRVSEAASQAAMALQAPLKSSGIDAREQWLAERRKSIGASEVPTVLGLNPWDTPLQLALRKRGEIPDKEETEAMRMGHKLEPVVAELYAKETCRVVKDLGKYVIQRNPEHPFLHATLDREVLNLYKSSMDSALPGDLQIKTVGAHMAHHWDEAVPLYVQAQVQAEMAAAELSWGSVAALIGGQRFVWKDIERNDEFIIYMVAKVEVFWTMIQKGDLPEAGAADNQAMRLLYPQHDPGKVIELPAIAMTLDEMRTKAKRDVTAAEKRQDEAEAGLKRLIGDAEYGVLPDGGRYSWKTGERIAYSVPAATTRTLRRLQA